MSLLNELALKYGTDKSSEHHNYCDKYDKVLLPLREQFTNVLEIGVLDGQSLRMWEEYFPNARICGLDINPECKCHETGRIKIIIADQGDEIQLKQAGEEFGLFDMILDDGSHKHKHQILSYKVLFPFIKRGGLYIVEDIFTSYFSLSHFTADWGETKYPPHYCLPDNGFINQTAIDYFKTLIDEVNYPSSVRYDPERYMWLVRFGRREDWCPNLPDVESITFLNSTVIIYKRNRI
jgi:hypothetical protein